MNESSIQQLHSALNVMYQNVLVAKSCAVTLKTYAQAHNGAESIDLANGVIAACDAQAALILPVLLAYNEVEGLN